MRVLLDTHVMIWWTGDAADRAKISQIIRNLLLDPANEILVSAATAWEMAIKAQSGKLRIAADLLDHYDTRIAQLGWLSLPILPAHGIAAAKLAGSHKDPFDRMLAAQARLEGLNVASTDRALAGLGATVVW